MPGVSDRDTERSPRGEQHGHAGPSRKRLRGEDGSSSIRKRATTACTLCRRRKAKCDNVRPQCGYCRAQKSVCQYDEDAQEPPPVDPASQAILERLDELKRILLNDGGEGPTEPITVEPTIGLVGSKVPPNAAVNNKQAGSLASAPETASPGGCLLFSKGKARQLQTSPESLLHWPVFRNILRGDAAHIDSFLFARPSLPFSPSRFSGSGQIPSTRTSARNDLSRQSLDEERMPDLCSKFIRLVHPRNPILHAETLHQMSRQVAEHGLAWDAHSCLLLIVCGIACLTTPWATPEYFADMTDNVPSPDLLHDAKPAAEAYFHAARKRIGLLDDSITSVQCLFFAAIYEKHALRPIEASQYIQQGFTRLQVYRLQNESSRVPGDDANIADRLLWSLVKAESELQPEVGITSVWPQATDISEALPAPPMHLTSSRPATADGFEDLEQRGWYFYLAEVSLRRRIEETVALMYEDAETQCVHRPASLVSRYQECATQVDLWYSHLHPSVRFEDDAFPNNELAFYLQGRFYEWRTLLLRPFLYCATSQDLKQVPQEIIKLAGEYVAICAHNITHLSYHGRHGGTWFACRSTFASAMSVLAAVTAGDQALCQLDLLASVKLSLRTLNRWAPEADDVELMRQILDGLLAEVCKKEGIF